MGDGQGPPFKREHSECAQEVLLVAAAEDVYPKVRPAQTPVVPAAQEAGRWVQFRNSRNCPISSGFLLLLLLLFYKHIAFHKEQIRVGKYAGWAGLV